LTSSSFLCSQLLKLWMFVACPRLLRRPSRCHAWRVPLGFFPGRAKDQSKIALFPSLSWCLQFGEPWPLGPYSRASASLSPPAMACTPRGPLRGRVCPGVSRLLRIVLVSSVVKTMARRALTSNAGDLLAAVHGVLPQLPLFPADASLSFPPPSNLSRPSWIRWPRIDIPLRGSFC
jgi:hypothetical protein